MNIEQVSHAMRDDLRQNWPHGKKIKHYTTRKKTAERLLTASFHRTMERLKIDEGTREWFKGFAPEAIAPYMSAALDKLHPDAQEGDRATL